MRGGRARARGRGRGDGRVAGRGVGRGPGPATSQLPAPQWRSTSANASTRRKGWQATGASREIWRMASQTTRMRSYEASPPLWSAFERRSQVPLDIYVAALYSRPALWEAGLLQRMWRPHRFWAAHQGRSVAAYRVRQELQEPCLRPDGGIRACLTRCGQLREWHQHCTQEAEERDRRIFQRPRKFGRGGWRWWLSAHRMHQQPWCSQWRAWRVLGLATDWEQRRVVSGVSALVLW